jgi:hypothetical protein
MSLDGEPPRTRSLSDIWDEGDMQLMLRDFLWAWDEADVVTGHYIRKFDLPILQGALFEFGFPLLDQKLVSDTKTDLVDIAAMSLSQENLAALHELGESKFHMNDNWWRKVARLTPEGLSLAKTRVVQDVIQHQELRRALSEAGALKPPSLWTPSR